MHSVLLSVEDAYNCLLDIEDLDSIKNALGPAAEGYERHFTAAPRSLTLSRSAQYMLNKRRVIVDELFKLLNVYIPDDNTPMVPDPNNQYILCVLCKSPRVSPSPSR